MRAPIGMVSIVEAHPGNEPALGTVRVSRVASITPTTTLGYRLDDGAVLVVDSTLSDVKLIAAAATKVNAVFFDRV